ncbi:MAG: cephalosporin hydroxylase [Chitinophagaceae bacterium]|nr:cephalosporin hydroxylase [Chitinophagaceae bacterium]
MNDPVKQFIEERNSRIKANKENEALILAAKKFNDASNSAQYSYNFSWMGRPIIQYPQDMIAMQEIIWEIKPDLIIETGIAHGGSLIYYASLLELIGNDGEVLGIDIDVRQHNRKEIENHKMFKRIKMIEGSSISLETWEKVKKYTEGKQKIIVILDSNHTHEHVIKELNLYSPFVSLSSYLVVFDTIVEDLPEGYFLEKRPWGIGNNPKTAVAEFLKFNKDFIIDKMIDDKLLVSVAPGGYLKKIR